MNTKLDLELRVFIGTGTAVRLQMIHDGTTTATVLLIEFVLAARGEVPPSVHVLQVELFGPLQDLVAAVAANQNPVIASVALHGLSEARYLLLPTQRTADQVRVQILFCVGMTQTDLLTALDGFARGTDLVIVGLPDHPKAAGLIFLGVERHDLLSATRSHLGRFRIEIVIPPAFNVSQLDGRTTRNSLPICNGHKHSQGEERMTEIINNVLPAVCRYALPSNKLPVPLVLTMVNIRRRGAGR